MSQALVLWDIDRTYSYVVDFDRLIYRELVQDLLGTRPKPAARALDAPSWRYANSPARCPQPIWIAWS